MKKIPNILSIARLILIPLIAWLIIVNLFTYAFFVALIIAITDILDGFLARLLKAESKIGSYLDAIADKAFIISIYMLIGTQNLLPVYIIIIVISRDIIILGSFALSFMINQRLEIKTLKISKINTFFQFVLLFLVLVRNIEIFESSILLENLTNIIIFIVIITTISSLLLYIKQWLNTYD
jgi:cardiolipin synthase